MALERRTVLEGYAASHRVDPCSSKSRRSGRHCSFGRVPLHRRRQMDYRCRALRKRRSVQLGPSWVGTASVGEYITHMMK